MNDELLEGRGLARVNALDRPFFLPRWLDNAFSFGIPLLVDTFSGKRRFLGGLWSISSELDSGNYDGEVIAQRLKAWEGKGYYVHSQVYSLLRLPSFKS